MTKQSSTLAQAATEQPSILIVDDEVELGEALSDLLTFERYRVALANDGSAGLQQLQREIPMAVILDMLMPGMNGNEMLRRMRAEPKWAHIPVIVSTSDPSNAPSGILVLRKPIHFPRLLDALTSIRVAPRALD